MIKRLAFFVKVFQFQLQKDEKCKSISTMAIVNFQKVIVNLDI